MGCGVHPPQGFGIKIHECRGVKGGLCSQISLLWNIPNILSIINFRANLLYMHTPPQKMSLKVPVTNRDFVKVFLRDICFKAKKPHSSNFNFKHFSFMSTHQKMPLSTQKLWFLTKLPLSPKKAHSTYYLDQN